MSLNRFRSNSKVVKIKNRMNYLINDSLNEDIDLDGLVKFARKYQIMINNSL